MLRLIDVARTQEMGDVVGRSWEGIEFG
jgi:hypothetical protein